jgi:flavin-dependent dehydrogenase
VACGRLAVLDGMYDVGVVGSGPAGAVAALLTARQGRHLK